MRKTRKDKGTTRKFYKGKPCKSKGKLVHYEDLYDLSGKYISICDGALKALVTYTDDSYLLLFKVDEEGGPGWDIDGSRAEECLDDNARDLFETNKVNRGWWICSESDLEIIQRWGYTPKTTKTEETEELEEPVVVEEIVPFKDLKDFVGKEVPILNSNNKALIIDTGDGLLALYNFDHRAKEYTTFEFPGWDLKHSVTTRAFDKDKYLDKYNTAYWVTDEEDYKDLVYYPNCVKEEKPDTLTVKATVTDGSVLQGILDELKSIKEILKDRI